ncbi:hypothetical protein EMIT0196P_30419 [Pseudomonas chlororaphis]
MQGMMKLLRKMRCRLMRIIGILSMHLGVLLQTCRHVSLGLSLFVKSWRRQSNNHASYRRV